MSTSMHRLQISLPRWQVQFLAARARRDEISIAQVVRQMIQHESEVVPTQDSVDSFLGLAGLAEDTAPLLDAFPVSERPDLYLAALSVPATTGKTGGRRARKKSR